MILPGTIKANAFITPTPSVTPNTQYVGSGPFSNVLRMQFYPGVTGDVNEYNALCFAQPTSCVPQIDLTDVQIPTSEITSANLADSRFYVTPETPAFDYVHMDFNLANSFYGVTFCNGADGITPASTCPDGPGGTPIPATCPNIKAPVTNCSQAGIAIRQGIAHIIDKASYVTNVVAGHGAAIDNVLAPAQKVIHSGQDICGACNPSTTPANIGPYAVDSSTGLQIAIGSEPNCIPTGPPSYAYSPTPCELTVGGTCSWDLLVTCTGTFLGQTQVSAFHLSGDAAATANGMIPPGSPDFCAAAQDWVDAGLGTSVSTDGNCQVLGFTGFNTGTPGTPGGPILIYRRTSLDRGPEGTGLGIAICQLIHGPATTSCLEVQVTTISLAQAHGLVFSVGCKTASEAGTTCSTQGPNRSWNIYSGGNTLGSVVDTVYALYNSQFASDLCGGSAPGEEANDYVMICNAKNDFWSGYSEFLPTVSSAKAVLQVVNDIFGNHTFVIPVFAHSAQYAYLGQNSAGSCNWQFVSNGAGIGIAQGNAMSVLNAWCAHPRVAGPTIVWGQKDSPATINPFSADSVTEFDILESVYDALLAPGGDSGNPYQPTVVYGWMADSFQSVCNPNNTQCVAPTTDSNCPLNVQRNDGTFPVGGCIKMVLRGDNSWHDVFSCAAANSACLQSHVVTASDVKFTMENYATTGGLLTPNVQSIVDVLYNPKSLPCAAYGVNPSQTGCNTAPGAVDYGGRNANGQTEVFYIALSSLTAWNTLEIGQAIPILPQHIWRTGAIPGPGTIVAPCLSALPAPGSTTAIDPYAEYGGPNTGLLPGACSADTAKLSGPGADPIANNMLIGSSGWVCSGTPGSPGVPGNLGQTSAPVTTYGGGCSTSGNGSPGAGDVLSLVRFQCASPNYPGSGATFNCPTPTSSRSTNYAYFRTNAKFKNFAWADFLPPTPPAGCAGGSAPNLCGPGARGTVTVNDFSNVVACFLSTAACSATDRAHWGGAATIVNTAAPGPGQTYCTDTGDTTGVSQLTASGCATAGPNITTSAGGGPGTFNAGTTVNSATVTQVGAWFGYQWYGTATSTGTAPLLYGVNGIANALNGVPPETISEILPAPGSGQQILYEDGTQLTS